MQSHMKRIIDQRIAQDIFSLNKLTQNSYKSCLFNLQKYFAQNFYALNSKKVRSTFAKGWTVRLGRRISGASAEDNQMVRDPRDAR